MDQVAASSATSWSTLYCKYPSKKCWNLRTAKRDGQLHQLCEFHRQKANANQRRMERRKRQQRLLVRSSTKATTKPKHSVRVLKPLPSLPKLEVETPRGIDGDLGLGLGLTLPLEASVFDAEMAPKVSSHEMNLQLLSAMSEMVAADVASDASERLLLDTNQDEDEEVPAWTGSLGLLSWMPPPEIELADADLAFLEHDVSLEM